jgi:NADH-quinone oxidoreductase subunit J
MVLNHQKINNAILMLTMTLFFFFFCIFSSLALLSSTLVIVSKNPVYSVLFLILTFCNVSSLLFMLNLEFLPITFLVVYVGAIAVLFLFVIMMLNIKLSDLKSETMHFVPAILLLACVFGLEIFVLTRIDFTPLILSSTHGQMISDFSNQGVSFFNSSFYFLVDHNMRSIGQVLFVEYPSQFIIVGYVLLLAMISAIVLTLQKTFISRTQNVYFQVLRDFDSCVTFYS